MENLSDLLNNFNTISTTLGIAWLTAAIPLAVLLFQNPQESSWDKAVVIHKIVRFPRLVVAIAFVFILPIFWANDSWLLRSIITAFGTVGHLLMVQSLLRMHSWLSSEQFRRKTSKNLLNTDLEEDESALIWKQAFTDRHDTRADELQVFETFVNRVRKFIESKEYQRAATLIGAYEEGLESRVFEDWVLTDKVLSEFLSIYEILYYTSKDLNSVQFFPVQLFSRLDLMLKKLIRIAIEKGAAYIVFEVLPKYLEGKDVEYQERLLASVSEVLFEMEDNNRSWDMWKHDFPDDWKITSEGLKEKNSVQHILLSRFVNWATPRLNRGESFDLKMNNVAEQLFPMVDPISWAALFTFARIPYGSSQVLAYGEYGKKFGLIGRMVVSGFGDEKEIVKEAERVRHSGEESTFDLAKTVFGAFYSIENLHKYRAEAEKLLGDDSLDARVKSNIGQLHKIFLSMLAFLSSGK